MRVTSEREQHTSVAASGSAAAGAETSTQPSHHDGHTRAAVVSLLVEDGPLTAGEIGDRLGISAAGVRRHLDALVGAGDVEEAPGTFGSRGGRGRPAKWFQLTSVGRGKLRHAYDDLAGAAMRKLRELGGSDAVEAFARERVERIVAEVSPAADGSVTTTVAQIADAMTGAGYSANTRQVGAGLQICQHHCPVAHVASEFPELCEAETAVFTDLLGTHVQRLATIANGDCVCTTHVPMAGGHSASATLPTPQSRGHEPSADHPTGHTTEITLIPMDHAQPASVRDNSSGKACR